MFALYTRYSSLPTLQAEISNNLVTTGQKQIATLARHPWRARVSWSETLSLTVLRSA